jgi:anti-sigma regulatory factor (Ser/Thr protein kinase)
VAYAEKWKSIYFSSNKGLFRVTKQKQTEIKLHGEPLNISKLVFYHDCLLALTADAQLYKISQHDSIQKVDIQSALKGQLPLGIKMLNKELYVFTKNSLFRYDLKKSFAEKIISINEDFEWNDLTVSGNKLVISTNKGYIITSPVPDIKFSKPVFVIDSIRAGSELHIGTNIESVEAENSGLHIYFSNLCYNPDNQNFVQYKINDDGWVKITDNRNVIDVESLKPGNYSIKFMYGNGFVNSETTELNFVVNKPYWQKWWFILFVITVLGFLIYRFDKWRTASINRKSQEIINRIELEKSANQSKLKALKSQMNPHFFFNALNTIQSFVLENDKKMAVNFLGKFSTLTRSILEMSDKDEVSVADEIKVLQLYLDIEMVRFNDDFEYKITTNDFDTELFKIPSLLLQPYIENAIKHGLLHKEGLKRLLISFTLEATELRIVIDDNGIGRKRSMELNAIKNKKHYSYATQANEKRVKLLNELAGRKITVEYLDETLEDGRVQGTTVIIKIPRQ